MATNDTAEFDSPSASGRWQLVRDIGMFQVKLLVDGFRDLLLVPVSLIAGIASFFSPVKPVGKEFYDLLRLGRQSERYINLFGAVERMDRGRGEPAAGNASDRPEDIDRIVERVENFVVDEYRHGRLTGQARDRLEKALKRLQNAAIPPK